MNETKNHKRIIIMETKTTDLTQPQSPAERSYTEFVRILAMRIIWTTEKIDEFKQAVNKENADLAYLVAWEGGTVARNVFKRRTLMVLRETISKYVSKMKYLDTSGEDLSKREADYKDLLRFALKTVTTFRDQTTERMNYHGLMNSTGLFHNAVGLEEFYAMREIVKYMDEFIHQLTYERKQK
ncbi:MAG: hypothetical protein BWY95_00114 [Bacteroidetes bacterium ADurb.BinA104]|jgi:hypothetical protein|nr:MAG: hypothetical protein BWY95_00114 [Bacteroidetes bacterium ADurb.BinA104]